MNEQNQPPLGVAVDRTVGRGQIVALLDRGERLAVDAAAHIDRLQAEIDRLRAENETLRAEKRIPAIFDPDTGRACVVERHDWCEGPLFWNVWIVRAPPNASLSGGRRPSA